MYKKNKTAQNTTEYLIVFVGVVAVIVYFVGPASPFRARYAGVLNQSANFMECSAVYLWEHGANCLAP